MSSMNTLTLERAVRAIIPAVTNFLTAFSSLSRRTETLSSGWITGCPITITHTCTITSKTARLATFFTLVAMVTRRTLTLSSHVITLVPLFTDAWLSTELTEKASRASVLAGGAVVSGRARAASGKTIACTVILADTLLLTVHTIVT